MNSVLLNQVSVQTEYLYRKDKKRGGEKCLSFSYRKERKKDRHKLDFKTRNWVRFLEQKNYFLTPLGSGFKKGESGGCENAYLSFRIRNKNLFFLKRRDTEPYYFEKQKDYLFCHLFWRKKKELERILVEHPRQFRKKWRELELETETLSQ